MNTNKKILLLLFLSCGLATVYSQAVNYCPSNNEENSCDIFGIEYWSWYNESGLLDRDDVVLCEGNKSISDCDWIGTKGSSYIYVQTFLDEEFIPGNSDLKYRMKLWLDRNGDREFKEDEILYDSESLDILERNHWMELLIPKDLDDGKYVFRARVVLLGIGNPSMQNFNACEYVQYSDVFDFSFHKITRCPDKRPKFELDISNDGCVYSFIPEETEGCMEGYQYAWSISPPDKQKTYQHYDGTPEKLEEKLTQIGIYEICLQVTEESPKGLFCVSHHCEKFWNNIVCGDQNTNHSKPLVFPTMTKDKLTIAFDRAIDDQETIKMYDANGRVVGRWQTSYHNFSIDMSSYSSGYYWFRITRGNDSFYHKVFKIYD